MENTLINELRAFLLAVSKHGDQHLAEADADLKQTILLLNEAIEKLGNSFMQVNTLIESQQAVIEEIKKTKSISDSHYIALDDYKAQIDVEVNSVVTGMQFQDMTNQLLHRTIQRVGGLQYLLHSLAMHGHDMPPEQEQQDIAYFLKGAHASLFHSSEALSGDLRKTVGQKDMSTGDVDLF